MELPLLGNRELPESYERQTLLETSPVSIERKPPRKTFLGKTFNLGAKTHIDTSPFLYIPLLKIYYLIYIFLCP